MQIKYKRDTFSKIRGPTRCLQIKTMLLPFLSELTPTLPCHNLISTPS